MSASRALLRTAPARLTTRRVAHQQIRTFAEGKTPRPATDPVASKQQSPRQTALIAGGFALVGVGIYMLRPKRVENLDEQIGNTPIEQRDMGGAHRMTPDGPKIQPKKMPDIQPTDRRPSPDEMAGGEKDTTTQGQSQGRKGEGKYNSREKSG